MGEPVEMQKESGGLLRRAFFSMALAVLITALTAAYQRPSGEIVRFATECGSPASCFTSPLAAGFPFAYLIDVPSVSVAKQLGPEDDFRLVPFAANCWFFLLLILLSPAAYRQIK